MPVLDVVLDLVVLRHPPAAVRQGQQERDDPEVMTMRSARGLGQGSEKAAACPDEGRVAAAAAGRAPAAGSRRLPEQPDADDASGWAATEEQVGPADAEHAGGDRHDEGGATAPQRVSGVSMASSGRPGRRCTRDSPRPSEAMSRADHDRVHIEVVAVVSFTVPSRRLIPMVEGRVAEQQRHGGVATTTQADRAGGSTAATARRRRAPDQGRRRGSGANTAARPGQAPPRAGCGRRRARWTANRGTNRTRRTVVDDERARLHGATA